MEAPQAPALGEDLLDLDLTQPGLEEAPHFEQDERRDGWPEATDLPILPIDRFADRELSWLAFNNRVLDLAKDTRRVPLLERAKFLAIFGSNLDEFYMVRVAGLKRRIAAGVAVPSISGRMPR